MRLFFIAVIGLAPAWVFGGGITCPEPVGSPEWQACADWTHAALIESLERETDEIHVLKENEKETLARLNKRFDEISGGFSLGMEASVKYMLSSSELRAAYGSIYRRIREQMSKAMDSLPMKLATDPKKAESDLRSEIPGAKIIRKGAGSYSLSIPVWKDGKRVSEIIPIWGVRTVSK